MAAELRVCVDTVGKWRSRFLEQRLDGLLDQPRSGRPRMIDDADVERVIALTLEATPKDATHWSTRSMARRSGLSHNTVSRIWRAFALQPHRTETFKLSADPLFIEKVRDIVGLYLNPPDRALVLCVDEKSQIQALDRTRPLLPLRPGQAELRTAMQPPLEVCSGLKTSVRVLFMSKPARVENANHSKSFGEVFQPFFELTIQEVGGAIPFTFQDHHIRASQLDADIGGRLSGCDALPWPIRRAHEGTGIEGRCHLPRGWLQGRSLKPSLSKLPVTKE